MGTSHKALIAVSVLTLAVFAAGATDVARFDPRLDLSFQPEPAYAVLFQSPFETSLRRVDLAPRPEVTAPWYTSVPFFTLIEEDAEPPFDDTMPFTLVEVSPESVPAGEYRWRIGDLGFSFSLPTGSEDGDFLDGYRNRVDGTQQTGFGVHFEIDECRRR